MDAARQPQCSICPLTEREHPRCPIAANLAGLIGIVMVTSGCPILDKLRPMVRGHLPFPEVSETVYRAISMYLLAQFFVYKRGGRPDWDLKHLVDIYEAISNVNVDFVRRLKTIKLQDASLNGLVSLNCFADIAVISILDHSLNEIENLFSAYLPADSRETA